MDTCFAGEVDVEEAIFDRGGAPAALADGVTSRAPAIAGAVKRVEDGVSRLVEEFFVNLRRGTGANVITASAGMEFVFAEEKLDQKNG